MILTILFQRWIVPVFDPPAIRAPFLLPAVAATVCIMQVSSLICINKKLIPVYGCYSPSPASSVCIISFTATSTTYTLFMVLPHTAILAFSENMHCLGYRAFAEKVRDAGRAMDGMKYTSKLRCSMLSTMRVLWSDESAAFPLKKVASLICLLFKASTHIGPSQVFFHKILELSTSLQYLQSNF